MPFKNKYDWYEFCDYIENEGRFFLPSHLQEFIENVRASSLKRKTLLQAGDVFYRAQIGAERKKKRKAGESIFSMFASIPLSPSRMSAPPRQAAKAGRANPAGISVLYLAKTLRTAIAETRPWKGAEVTVAQFQLRKSITVIDLTERNPKRLYSASLPPGQPELEQVIWDDINTAFSQPYDPNTAEQHYLPTQCIAEFFKKEGVAGILYSSALCPDNGINLVLFDPKDAYQKKGRQVRTVGKITYEH